MIVNAMDANTQNHLCFHAQLRKISIVWFGYVHSSYMNILVADGSPILNE